MDIIIPTYGRSNQQETLRQLTACGIKPFLVVQEREWEAYERYAGDATVVILPREIQTIAPTRQCILENVGDSDQFCMLDDDLTFYIRRNDDRTKLRDIQTNELVDAFFDMRGYLMQATIAHVGFAAREGANRDTSGVLWNTRIMRVLGYDRKILTDNNIRFDRMEVMEDFDVALQLLEAGFDNVVMNNYAHNQKGSGAAGGCSHFRTPALHAANAAKLAALHPRYVTVVEKTTKGSFGGGTRTDVRIAWKKARLGE